MCCDAKHHYNGRLSKLGVEPSSGQGSSDGVVVQEKTLKDHGASQVEWYRNRWFRMRWAERFGVGEVEPCLRSCRYAGHEVVFLKMVDFFKE